MSFQIRKLQYNSNVSTDLTSYHLFLDFNDSSHFILLALLDTTMATRQLRHFVIEFKKIQCCHLIFVPSGILNSLIKLYLNFNLQNKINFKNKTSGC